MTAVAKAKAEPAWDAARDRATWENQAWRRGIERAADEAMRRDVCYWDEAEGRWRSFAWLITQEGALG